MYIEWRRGEACQSEFTRWRGLHVAPEIPFSLGKLVMKSKFAALLLFCAGLCVTPLVGCGGGEDKVMPKNETSIDTPEEMAEYEAQSMGGADDEDQN